MDRRRFLGIVSATTAGLYFQPVGLIELPKKLVLAYAGSCSFCGKQVHEVFGLAGLRQGGPVRICDQCIGLCFDIIAEERMKEPPKPVPLPSFSPEVDKAMELLQLSRAELIAILEAEIEADRAKRPPPRRDTRNIVLDCSFCAKNQKEVAKLIAGPTVYICDGCIFDAAGLFKTARG